MEVKRRFKQNPGNTAIAYYRYSSTSQRDASIEEQKAEAWKYAAQHGYTIIKEYNDYAITGTTDERPEFKLMLNEVTQLRPSYLILWDTDRFARDRYDAATYKKRIRAAGVKIVYIIAGIPDNNEQVQNLIEAIKEANDENYIIALRENVTRGLRYNAEKALYNGRKMLGYRGMKDRPYEIDETTSPIVHKIFRDFIEGVPLQKLANDLNNSGMRSVNGKEFSINSLRHILKNRAYIGEYRYSDIVVRDGMPALIDEDTFLVAQAKFEEKSRKQRKNIGVPNENAKTDYWLTGHIECGNCHEPLHGVSGTSRHGYKCFYYYCLGRRRKKCNLSNKKKAELEAIVKYLLEELLNDSALIIAIAYMCYEQYLLEHSGVEGLINSYEVGLKRIRKSRNNILDAIKNGAYTKAFNAELEKLDKEEEAMQDSLDNARLRKDAELKVTDIIRFFYSFAGNLDDPKNRKKLLDILIEKIYVYEEEVVITFYFSQDQRILNIQETMEMINNRKKILEYFDPNYKCDQKSDKPAEIIPLKYETVDGEVIDLCSSF